MKAPNITNHTRGQECFLQQQEQLQQLQTKLDNHERFMEAVPDGAPKDVVDATNQTSHSSRVGGEISEETLGSKRLAPDVMDGTNKKNSPMGAEDNAKTNPPPLSSGCRGGPRDENLNTPGNDPVEDVMNPQTVEGSNPDPEQVPQDHKELQRRMHDRRMELTRRRMKKGMFKKQIRECTPNIAQQMKMGKRITIPGQDHLIQKTPHGINKIMCVNTDPEIQRTIDDLYDQLRESYEFQPGPQEDQAEFPVAEGIGKKMKARVMKLDARRSKQQKRLGLEQTENPDEFPPIVYGSDTMNKIKSHLCNPRGETLGEPLKILQDSGADGSLISYQTLKERNLDTEITRWTGLPFRSGHDEYHILGQYLGRILMGGKTFTVRWCVVMEETIPILGIDFLSFHQDTTI